MPSSDRKDGKLLEKVLETLCSGIKDSEVIHDTKVIGKLTNRKRQIDVLIKGNVGLFEVKIEVEAKDYSNPVSIDKVEAFAKKLEDTGSDLGVMVCPLGFQAGAKSVAKANGIQLFEIESEELNNTKLFIPIRLVISDISRWSVRFFGKLNGPFYIPPDLSKVRVVKEGKELDLRQLLGYAWNTRMFPQKVGKYEVQFDAVKILDIDNPNKTQYCELSFNVEITGSYYLKMFPASFLRNIEKQANHYFLNIPLYSNIEDMKQNWMEFESMEKLNEAAEIDEQPEDIRNLLIMPEYSMDIDKIKFDS